MKIRNLAMCAAMLAAGAVVTVGTAYAVVPPKPVVTAAEKQKAAEQLKAMGKKFGPLVRQGKELKALRAKLAAAPAAQKKGLEKQVNEAITRWTTLFNQAMTLRETDRDKITADIAAAKAKNGNTATLDKKLEAAETEIKDLKSLSELIGKV